MLILQQLFSLQEITKGSFHKVHWPNVPGNTKMSGIKGFLLLFLVLGAMYLGAQAEADHHRYGECRKVHRWQLTFCELLKVNFKLYNLPSNVSFNCLPPGAYICRFLLHSRMWNLLTRWNHLLWVLLWMGMACILVTKFMEVLQMVSESTGNGLVMYMNVYSVCWCVVSELTSASPPPSCPCSPHHWGGWMIQDLREYL